ncbi:MAG: transglycosylase SLT domain-containing protein, partial [Campylobacterales bacterium]|nr:transglycosylase SLT domain-containing protein [Campylobacterales bacterium]
MCYTKNMNRFFLFLSLLMLSAALYARSDVEAINLSLQSLQSEETLMDTDVLDGTLDRYRGTIRPLYKRYLATQPDFKRIEAKCAAAGIPRFFALIPYAESKFNPSSRGYNTAGLWQFTKQSARHFGLKVTKDEDQRLDIDRSTDAAIRYITSLKKEFGSWYLADFAYAMGEGKLKQLIARNKSTKISVLLKDPH